MKMRVPDRTFPAVIPEEERMPPTTATKMQRITNISLDEPEVSVSKKTLSSINIVQESTKLAISNKSRIVGFAVSAWLLILMVSTFGLLIWAINQRNSTGIGLMTLVFTVSIVAVMVSQIKPLTDNRPN